ncbi:calcyphosin isoform 2 [Chrysochromulina tobinii]|uniref:Calcyphosin isoform 2 n=1 Tax=Chrysochromulina tobinii TaxID=1460289 RepID=A0A0M0J3L0_9EUKA|nr:calcyphosin isoform 2 [Chrysochromulina tobinii]|eukprot:KOO21159.1 calcyphosin isoform 2 [Chrysochromulina sp. CCMP291]
MLDEEGDEANDAAHQADDEAGSPSPKLSVPRRRQQPRPLQAVTGAQPGESQAPAPPPPPAPRSEAPARRYIPPPEGRKPKPKPVAAPEPADTFVDDSTLSFDEFTALVATLEPKRDFSDADLSRRFDELKPSADGRVFAQDVRLTLLWEALSRKAGRVIDLFRKWDDDGSGSVDADEFGRALSQLGFVFSSRDTAFIFEHLDVDGSGTVDYNELNSRLRPKTMARQLYKLRTDASLKRGAARMNLQGGKQTLDLSPGAPPVQEQIQAIIMANRLRILDTFRMWDVDGDGAISCEEFADAFAALGYAAARADLDAVFDRFDQDGSGRVDYLEMSAQLHASAEAPPEAAEALLE